MDEKTFLDSIKEHIDVAGYNFDKRLLAAFHTSLKINDIACLTVNAGISGTGKSQLPKLYADAAGIHFRMVAIKPGWDSPQDLFGYYNYVERSFKPTKLSQDLVQFDKFNGKKPKLKDEMLMVLLDEMNLARVEYYFSDILSKMEMRSNIKSDNIVDRESVNIELDIGRLPKGESNPKIFIDRNVLFVGTMNEDESTHSLSDKLIDRANVIRFGAPKELESDMPEPPAPKEEKLSYADWQGNWKKAKDTKIGNTVKDSVNNLNKALELIGKPFGHRVYQAILAYMANYPYGFCGEDSEFYPLVDQVMMRALPRLEGMDTTDEKLVTCIGKIKDILSKSGDNSGLIKILKDYQNRPYFSWKGIDYSGVRNADSNGNNK